MQSDRRPNVCVVGCGYWGKNLVRSFLALDQLHAISESHEPTAQSLRALYPGLLIFDSYEAALKDPRVDAIVLATPAAQHYSMGMAAIKARKHLFVEKPLALEWRQGSEMVEAARRFDCILMVGHLLQYHPAVRKLQELLRAGVLGEIEYIYSNRLSMGKIRREENALWSFAPHDISVVLSLIGQMPVQVSATGGAYLQPNVADVTVSNLLFDRGVRAHIFVSWLHPYKEQRLVVIGSKQMIVFEDSRPDQKLLLFDRHIEQKNGTLEAAKTLGRNIPFEGAEPLLLECKHFIDCVQNGGIPRTPGSEGVQVLQVLESCQRSLQMNGEPVQMMAQSAFKMVAM